MGVNTRGELEFFVRMFWHGMYNLIKKRKLYKTSRLSNLAKKLQNTFPQIKLNWPLIREEAFRDRTTQEAPYWIYKWNAMEPSPNYRLF